MKITEEILNSFHLCETKEEEKKFLDDLKIIIDEIIGVLEKEIK